MEEGIEVRPHPEGSVLEVRVSPGSARDRVLGAYGPRLKVAVRAPPERGRANRALVTLLARALGVPRGRVQVVSGAGSPDKAVLVRGLPPRELREALDRLLRKGR